MNHIGYNIHTTYTTHTKHTKHTTHNSHNNLNLNKTDLLKSILKIPIENNSSKICQKNDTQLALEELKKILNINTQI